jgi:hypothetical protein
MFSTRDGICDVLAVVPFRQYLHGVKRQGDEQQEEERSSSEEDVPRH